MTERLTVIVQRVKELTSKHRFKCAAIAPNRMLAATGDDNNFLNLWSFQGSQPIMVRVSRKAL